MLESIGEMATQCTILKLASDRTFRVFLAGLRNLA